MSDQKNTDFEVGKQYEMTAVVTVVIPPDSGAPVPMVRVNSPAFPLGTIHVDITQAEFEPYAEPEPDWQPGDVAVDSNGLTLLRTGAGNWVHQRGSATLDRNANRPLTPLVLGGKPVAS